MNEENKLWAILIPGPDDVYAMGSEEKAKEEAAEHNKIIDGGTLDQVLVVSKDSLYAQVIEWPHSPELHAECLESGESEWMP